MAQPSSRTTGRGRTVVKQRRRPWIVPLVFGILVFLTIAGGNWQQGRQVSTASGQPIATLDTQDVHALMWSPTESNTVFLGHHNGLLKSSDGGRTWQPTALTGADAMSLAASSRMPMRLYVAGHGVFRRSDDGGATWTAPAGKMQGADIHAFAQSPTDPDQVFALVANEGILGSSDGGMTWRPVSTAPAHAALTFSPDGTSLLLGTGSGIQQSTDQGATWTPFGGELPQPAQVLGLAFHPDGTTLFAATTEGLFRRSGTAGSWEKTALAGTIMTVAVNPTQPAIILAVDDQKRVYRSDDGGATW
jgi:photosystem II stability/assembly factor-like uncharacterized protein